MYLQNRALGESKIVFLKIGPVAMQLRPLNVKMILVSQTQKILRVFVCVNGNKSLTEVLVKPLPVQKSICLLIRPFHYPENKGN